MPRTGPIFVARASYRQRRLRDGVRMMPVFGIALWLIPLLSSGRATSSGIGLYIFFVWMLLIVFTGLIASRMSRNINEPEGSTPRDGTE